ncbi:major facilitator superfamily transporter isoform A [Lecanosticta acicola]|uniref:Major facilitator superfamily transporter isoform A n=1 Tax=Lecanosticta acicola TaxID=111012 RepID=A0AAI8VV90_9PEZI|nr:major facilitator superfamily transporter isoform A [Lecanosticta acicola]
MRLCTLRELDKAEGTVQLHSESGDGHLILHPRPNTNDPNDPLRWSRWRKYTCFFSVCFFAFMTNYAIGGLAPAFYPLSLQFHKSTTQTSDLLLWPILALGVFNFFWVPLANYIGKRPVFVFSTFVLAAAYLWGALAGSFQSLLWSNILAAFAGSASEALAASIVNDVFFLHERANLMSWYVNASAGGNTIGPLICGFVITHSRWRVHKWHAFALVAFNFLLVLFFVPETRYDRSFNEEDMASDTTISQRNSSEPSAGEVKEAPEAAETQDGVNFVATDPQKQQPLPVINANDPAHCHHSTEQIPKRTFLQDLSIWPGLAKDINPLLLFLRPLPFICYPAVILAFLGFAVSLAWVVCINILNSFVLQAPPYNFSPDINGLINIPGLIGNLIGAWIGGWCLDRYSNWQSKRHAGTFQPETRLHLLIIPALVVPAGCLVWGYGVANTLHWTALFFAYGMVSVGLTAVPTMTMTYVSDSYLPINADCLTLVVGLKNVVAFGILYGVVPWVHEAGNVNVFGTQAGVYVAIMALAVPLVIWGGRVRHWSAGWRIIL